MDASTLKMVSSKLNGWSTMMKKNHKLMRITMLYRVDVTRVMPIRLMWLMISPM